MKTKFNFFGILSLMFLLLGPVGLLAYDFDQADAGDTLIIEKGTYNFEYDNIDQYITSRWEVNGEEKEVDDSGFFAIDPDIDVAFSYEGEYKLEVISENNQDAIWYPTVVPTYSPLISALSITVDTATIRLLSDLLIGNYYYEMNYKLASSSIWSSDIVVDPDRVTIIYASSSYGYLDIYNLEAASLYDVRARTCNRGGCTDFNTTQFTTLGDDIPPANPTSFETTPLEGVPTDDINIAVSWSGASDNIGLSGYYFLFDNSTDTNISSSNASFVNDATGSSQQSYGFYEDTFYFHLRYTDESGNLASDTVHLGPFILGGASQGVNPAIIMYLLN